MQNLLSSLHNFYAQTLNVFILPLPLWQILTTTFMKTLRSLIFFFVLFASNIQFTFSQTGREWLFNMDEKDILEAKRRPLLVVLATEDADKIKKMTKKKKMKDVANYRKNIKIYNQNLKASVEKFWKSNEKIEYKTDVEVEELRKEKKLGSYALLEHDVITHTTNTKNQDNSIFYSTSTTLSKLSLYIGRKKRKGNVMQTVLPSFLPSKEEFAVGMNYMQLLMQDYLDGKSVRERKKVLLRRSKELADLTLLVDKNDVEKGVTLAKLKAVYPFKIEITTQQRINKAIWEQEPGFCFLQIVPLNGTNSDGSSRTFWQSGPNQAKTMYAQIVINCATGYQISYSGPALFATQFAKSRRELDEKTLKEIYNKYEKSMKIDEKDAENDTVPTTDSTSETEEEK